VLVADGLVKYYGKTRVVDQVSLEVNRGEVVGLLGPNGAGKTTTFYMVVGLLEPHAGTIWLDEQELTGLPIHQRARRGIGYLPQEPSVFRKLTVRENILAVLENQELSQDEREERLESLLKELNIAPLRDRKGYSLSGGERRRVEITRALAANPRFILLDEPFVGIDPIAVGEMQEIVARLRERGLGLLVTDHNVRETLSVTDRSYIMYEGRILFSGSSEELTSDPQARKIYLGENFRL
jgi:lipopolysaccharide export system ATP-binding protein